MENVFRVFKTVEAHPNRPRYIFRDRDGTISWRSRTATELGEALRELRCVNGAYQGPLSIVNGCPEDIAVTENGTVTQFTSLTEIELCDVARTLRPVR